MVTDQNQGFVTSPKPTMTVAHEGGGTDVLTAWHKIGSTAHGSFHLLDYDLTQPSTLPEDTKTTTLATTGAAARDVFEWPALELTQSDVAARARLKMEAAEAEAGLIEAMGANPGFMPGTRFTIAADPYTARKTWNTSSAASAAADTTKAGSPAGVLRTTPTASSPSPPRPFGGRSS